LLRRASSLFFHTVSRLSDVAGTSCSTGRDSFSNAVCEEKMSPLEPTNKNPLASYSASYLLESAPSLRLHVLQAPPKSPCTKTTS